MKTLRSSFDQFLQGELDSGALTVQLEKFVQNSPEETKVLVDQITRLSQGGTVTPETAAKLENTLVLIKAAETRLALKRDGSARISLNSAESPHIPSNSSSSDYETLGIGSIIKDRFELIEILGKGGMGIVYKARDQRKVEARDRNPYVALKVLSEDFKRNPDSFIALQREARKCQDLAHPNIVTVYDFDKDGPHVYMTMECLSGRPLGTLLNDPNFKAKSMQRKWAIISQIGSGLSYAHEKKIIHSDLKPGNIFINDDDAVKILDFGIARAAKDSEQRRADTTIFNPGDLNCLTPAYASCEMFENKPPDIRDDIYAFGCVAYGVFTGNHPYNRLPAIQARNNSLVPRLIKGIKRKQWKALKRTLAFERNNRTPSIKQFLAEAQLDQDSTRSGREFLRWLGPIFFIVIFFAGLYSYKTLPGFAPLTEPEPLAWDANETLSQQEKEKVSRLLEVADLHLAIGRFAEPPASNALFAYREALQIDPGNPSAKQGIKKITDHFINRSQHFLADGDKSNALRMAESGLKAFPKNQTLRRLYNQTKN